jgi:hypothetical protein
MHTAIPLPVPCKRAPWNKSRLIGQKRPLHWRAWLLEREFPTDAPVSEDRTHKRRVPRLREGPRPAARLWRFGCCL